MQLSLFRFGGFEMNLRTRELWRTGVRIRLQDQPFQILAMMLERPGEIVTREEIRDRLWADGTNVDFEHGVNAAIKRLRTALGDSAESPRFVETLHRRGYRFIAPVEVHDPALARVADASAAIVPPHPDRRKPQSTPVVVVPPRTPNRFTILKWWYASVLVCLLLGGLAYVRYRSLPDTAAVAPRRSVAVLGFRNLSGRAEQA